MALFVIFAALLVVIALAFALWPLLFSPQQSARNSIAAQDEANIESYRAQRRELDAEHAAGRISFDEHQRAVEDLATRLSQELSGSDTGGESSSPLAMPPARKPWILAASIAVLLPIGAIASYASLGNLGAIRLAEMVKESGAAQKADGASMTDKQVLALVESLAKKMEENPSDPRGWALLARTQATLGQTAQALQAFERAAVLSPKDADLLADYADTLVVAAEGKFEGKPYEVIQRALRIAPTHPKSLALLGTAEMRMGNRKASLAAWEKLRAQLPADSDDARQVDAIITEVKTGASTPPVAAGARSAGDAPNAQASPASVTGTVVIAPALQDRLQKNDTLFVLARASTGSVMPLAIIRVPAPSTWPFAFELTDAMAMAAGANLSSASEVIVEARISRSGNARLQPGDLVGRSLPIKPTAPNARGLRIVIAEVIG